MSAVILKGLSSPLLQVHARDEVLLRSGADGLRNRAPGTGTRLAHDLELLSVENAALNRVVKDVDTGKIQELRAALETNPMDHEARHKLALAYFHELKYEEAIEEGMEVSVIQKIVGSFSRLTCYFHEKSF